IALDQSEQILTGIGYCGNLSRKVGSEKTSIINKLNAEPRALLSHRFAGVTSLHQE
ncbi:hypothetical protein GGI05_004525, partial [Coemansia sp. RSA 2603]